MNTELIPKNGERGFHTWDQETSNFQCSCGMFHVFGEPGTIYHRPTHPKHNGQDYVFVICLCGIWHGKRANLY